MITDLIPANRAFFSPLSQINEDVLAPHLSMIAIHCRRRVLGHLPVRDVILPAVPRASHHLALQRTLPQRPPAMQACVVDRINLPADVGHGHRFSLYLQLPYRSRRKFRHLHRPHKRHCPCPRSWHRHSCLCSSSTNSPPYLGSATCAIITLFLNSSAISGRNRTSVGLFAKLMLSILSCSFKSA